jgi:putative MATE family efflux protein
MRMAHSAILTKNPVGTTLIKLTIPMIGGMIGMVIFNLIDTYFVGKLGTDQLAAMSFTFPVVMLQGSIAMGLGVGTSAVVSRLIGRGNHHKVKRQATDSLLLSLIVVIVLMFAGLFTVTPVFTLLGAKGRVLELIKEYMLIWYIGAPFVVIPMVGNNVIRAAGNTVIPALIMLIAACLNAVLDPLLIFGLGPFPALGLKGAALATVIARAGTLLAALLFLNFRFNMLTFKLPKFRDMMLSWKEMLFVGVPAALTQLIMPVTMGVITRMVSEYGKQAVAAVGVGTRIQMFALSPVMALSVVILPFVGQNMGAGKPDRIKEGIKKSQLFSFIFGAALFIVFICGGRLIGTLFSRDSRVIEVLYEYLVIVSGGYGLWGIMRINASVFNAIRKPFHSMGLNLLRTFLLYIPLAFVFSLFFKLEGIFLAALASAVIAGIVSWLWVSSATKQLIRS